MVCVEECFTGIEICAYVTYYTCVRELRYRKALPYCPPAPEPIPLHAVGYDALFRSLSYQFLTGFSPEIFLELHGRENGPRSCLLTLDLEKERTKFQFYCSDFMLCHNCRASFPAYKLKSSLQYIFASIIAYPRNSILTVFYSVH